MRPSRHRLAAVGATVATAVAGGLLTDPTSAWFQALRKPPWYPPPATFGVVWTGLYAGMAWAGGEVLERTDDRRAFARAATLNLILNAGWTPVFFRAHRPALAAVESAVLTVSTADLIRRAGRVSPVARAVLVPYGVWTAFATALSTDIARRNPEGLSRR